MTSDPHPPLDVGELLGDVAELLDRYRRLDPQPRTASERLYHLDRLMETLRGYALARKPAGAVLVAIAAQAVQWAAALEGR